MKFNDWLCPACKAAHQCVPADASTSSRSESRRREVRRQGLALEHRVQLQRAVRRSAGTRARATRRRPSAWRATAARATRWSSGCSPISSTSSSSACRAGRRPLRRFKARDRNARRHGLRRRVRGEAAGHPPRRRRRRRAAASSRTPTFFVNGVRAAGRTRQLPAAGVLRAGHSRWRSTKRHGQVAPRAWRQSSAPSGSPRTFSTGFWRPRPHRALDALSFEIPVGRRLRPARARTAPARAPRSSCCIDLLRPTSGRAEVLGRPPGDVERAQRLGFLPENPTFYDHLTAEELLDVLRRPVRLSGRGRAARARRACSIGRPRRRSAPAAAAVLEGHGAARRPGAGARQRSGARHSRRADVGPRSDRPPRSARADPPACATKAARCSSARTSCRTPSCCAAASAFSRRASWSRRARVAELTAGAGDSRRGWEIVVAGAAGRDGRAPGRARRARHARSPTAATASSSPAGRAAGAVHRASSRPRARRSCR